MFEDADLIHRYTRKQAIEDGVLVDLTEGEFGKLVREAGFKFPLAITAAAYTDVLCPLDGKLPEGQDLMGRLWDVLTMLKVGIRKMPPHQSEVHFTVAVFDGRDHQEVKLWALCGPGDAGEPVITIMLEGED